MVVAVGKAEGVQVHDPVVTDQGLVGQVTKLAAHQAQVTLLTDASSAVSALDLRTGASGIVQLNDTGSTLIMDQVSKAKNVFADDALALPGGSRTGSRRSTRVGSRFGRVSSVSQTDIDPYKEIVAKPFVDFSSLESVLVLVSKVAPK